MIELLAPGGSPEGMRAALAAGADAIYMGGTKFGARAYAVNAGEADLMEAIDTCHLHGAKLYLTVNTLLRGDELEGQLYDFLAPLCAHGLDAVLVQDLGVLRFIRREFPHLPVHASTQMTLTGADGARLLYREGAERIVPSRELSLAEIRHIHESCPIEIECFVHGALCYCYSGQCLMSSMIGGRSGNRGRCAQPCRLPYRTEGEKPRYLMSLKDICTLEILPDMLEAGVCSLKIEGRMKRPEYAAGVTAVYRKYLDLLADKGREGYAVREEDVRTLQDLYCRGGFSAGYAKTHNGPQMMTMDRPNHEGSRAAKVVKAAGGSLTVRALEPLFKGDVLEIPAKRADKKPAELTLGRDIAAGREERLACPAGAKGMTPAPGTILMRTHCPSLLEEIGARYLKTGPQEEIKGTFILQAGECAILEASLGKTKVRVIGAAPEKAVSRAVSPADIEKQLRKTGSTPFVFGELGVNVEDGLFYPLQAVNELRRRALTALAEEICAAARRPAGSGPKGWAQDDEVPGQKGYPQDEPVPVARSAEASADAPAQMPALRVSVETREQAEAVLAFLDRGKGKENPLQAVYADCAMFLSPDGDKGGREKFAALASALHGAGCRLLLTLPPIWRGEVKSRFLSVFDEDTLGLSDGFLIRSAEQLLFVQDWRGKKEIAADAGVYTWNREARAFLAGYGVDRDTVPFELTGRQIEERGAAGSEMVVYGRIPLMITAQCIRKNLGECRRRTGVFSITDRMGAQFPVRNSCVYCMNTIYNSVPLDLRPVWEKVMRLGCASVRFAFTTESGEETGRILSGHIPAQTTRGHFARGVE